MLMARLGAAGKSTEMLFCKKKKKKKKKDIRI